MEVKHKICVITGGTSGIGLSIVKKLLSLDVKFIGLFELENTSSKAVFKDLEKKFGNRIGFYPCDVTDTSKLSENFDKIIESYKKIDILINNAGIANENNPALMIDVNYKAVILGSLMMIERVGKHKGGNGGVIVNIASVLGLINIPYPIYCSAKHGVVSFTRAMTEQFDVTGVRVVAICPGLTDTPLLENLDKGLEFINYVGRLDPFPNQPPENVADAVIKIIESGKNTDVWVSEANQPPYAVKDVGHYKDLRIK